MILATSQRRASSLATIAMGVGVAAFLSIHAMAGDPTPLKVGAVTRHPERFVGQHVLLSGYLLAREAGYILFSDEPRGRISSYDLPVVGPSVDRMVPTKRYMIEGEFRDHGLTASNGSHYHLELSAPPRAVEP
jgi:hypothetical protein